LPATNASLPAAWSSFWQQDRYHQPRGELNTINPDGSGLTPVIKNVGIAGFENSRWSPDSTKLIFHGSPDIRHIQLGLWTTHADGSNLTKIITGPPNPINAVWRTHPQQ